MSLNKYQKYDSIYKACYLCFIICIILMLWLCWIYDGLCLIFTGDTCNVSSTFYKYSQIALEIMNK